MYYYNHECISTSAYCSLANLTMHNETFCQDPNNSTIMKLANSSLKTISASEDYFKWVIEIIYWYFTKYVLWFVVFSINKGIFEKWLIL